jgi:hypothetical protein
MIGFMLMLGVLMGTAPAARAADPPGPQETAMDPTPPRLSFTDGQVSFWRPGAQDWAGAQVNTPLAPGDELYTGSPGNLELQIGPRAFVRGWANTQVGLANQEPGFLQFNVTTGSATFDLRTLEPGTTVEVATPNAALTIEHAGYYRVDVAGERTAFITRRAGQATLTPASGEAVVITPSEEVVVEGIASPRVTSYVAPQLDDWDKWNYARSESHLDAVSARYVSPGTYGVSDLDSNGTWRTVPTYGPVWIPTTVQTGWAPYTTGSWTLDPTYGWTWVDAAPWGWAPYHYGRWVSVDGFWAWAPGPVIARPVYAPALVAFFGGPSLRVGVSIGGPVLGWVALGWGEPLVPWWGRPGFVHEPSWRGWGGPHVVNNVVINNTTVVNVQNINVYRNSSVPNAVMVVNENRFGRGPITGARVTQVDVKSLQPIHTAPQITATPASFVPTASRGIRPPEETLKRSVVATRPPHAGPESATGGERKAGPAGIPTPTPAPRIVSAPPRHEPGAAPARPPLGQSGVERRTPDRAQPPSPPKPPVARQAPPQQQREPQATAAVSATPRPSATPVTAPPSRAGRPEQPAVAAPATSAPPSPAAPATPSAAPARRPEQPRVAAPSPSAVPSPNVAPSPAAPATPSAAPARRPEQPRMATPSPSAVPSPSVAPSPAAPATPSAPPGRRPEQPRVATPSPSAPPSPAAPATTPTPRGRGPEKPGVAAPSPAAPATPSAPPERRPEQPRVAAPPAHPPLPGEPANRLSPNRGQTPSPEPAQR